MRLVQWRCGEGNGASRILHGFPFFAASRVPAKPASLPDNGHSTERTQLSAAVPCISSISSPRTVCACMQDATANTGGLGPMYGRDHGCCGGRELTRCASAWWRAFEKGISKTLESSPPNLSHACQSPHPLSSRLDRWPYRIRRRDIWFRASLSGCSWDG